MAQAKTDRYRVEAMEAAQELGKIGAGSDPYHDCVVADCDVKRVFAHAVTLCQHCRKETCYPHRFQDKHDCIKTAQQTTKPISSPAPRPLERPCGKTGCRVKIDPDKRKGDACPKCTSIYCWTHQKEFMHDCKPPQSTLVSRSTGNPMDAFRSMFRAKNEAKGRSAAPRTKAIAGTAKAKSASLKTPDAPTALSNRISSFKKPTANPPISKDENLKGSSLPRNTRIVVYLQAEAPKRADGAIETKASKIPEIKAYFDGHKKVGQILDVACGYLALENNNNKDPDPNSWWSFYNLNRAADPIPQNSDKFADFAKDGDQLILMKGLAAFRSQ